MLRSLFLTILCAVALPAFCEPSAKYEVATILDVKPHQSAGNTLSSAAATYDVSVKVAGTLVQVGKNTIAYNDISGRSQEVPIISQKSARTATQ